ncbi:MAG TPA: XamI family restriction endonuclease [Tepidisphaeraceae bacterium]|jgi:hypothetical protein|nr:XamI family restriction endonuclease [Tepidisphaeraceae bacterium]
MQPERVNADKPHLWKADIAASVDRFNQWFLRFAPLTFRSTRVQTTESVKAALLATDDLRNLDVQTLRANPGAIRTLRMCTAPPIAVDRLIGLSSANKSLIGRMESGQLAKRMKEEVLIEHLSSVCRVIEKLLDRDIFPWLDSGSDPTDHDRVRAATIIADRWCAAEASSISERARANQQISVISRFLESLGYREVKDCGRCVATTHEPGTYGRSVPVPVATGRKWLVPFDIAVLPPPDESLQGPVLIDVESPACIWAARRRARSIIQKQQLLQTTYGDSLSYLVMFGGVLDAGVLGMLAAAGTDWIWQHRIEVYDARLPDRYLLRT